VASQLCLLWCAGRSSKQREAQEEDVLEQFPACEWKEGIYKTDDVAGVQSVQSQLCIGETYTLRGILSVQSHLCIGETHTLGSMQSVQSDRGIDDPHPLRGPNGLVAEYWTLCTPFLCILKSDQDAGKLRRMSVKGTMCDKCNCVARQ
jgi:hypothetical protein